MNKLLKVDLETLKNLEKLEEQSFAMSGLSKGKIGFLVSGPDVGKTYFCLSLAYELSSSVSILGLKAKPEPIKVLYWPIEDGAGQIAKRIIPHLESFDEDTQNEINNHFAVWSGQDPICTLRNGSETLNSESSRVELIEAATNFDLLIIDTLREAAGNAHEVDDDLVVKNILQDIARKANVAILVVHHLNKDTVKGKEKLTNVSGSGYSTAQANAKLILSLEKKGSKLSYSQLKANFVSHEKKQVDVMLDWAEQGYLYSPKNLNLDATAVETAEKWDDKVSLDSPKEETIDDILDAPDVKALIANRKSIPTVEPVEISIDSVVFSEEAINKRKEKAKKSALLTSTEEELLRQFHAKNKRST